MGIGVTPLTIQQLPRGSNRIRVTKEGYAGAERIVTLDGPRATRTLRISLERLR